MPRQLEAKGIDIDIPVLEIAKYCRENHLGEVERTLCCYCKPVFGAAAGPITRCPCHTLSCVAHALCRERAHHGAGCKRCKFHIPLAAPRTQVDREILAQQRRMLASRFGPLTAGEHDVEVLKGKVSSLADRFGHLNSRVDKLGQHGQSSHEVGILNEKVSALAGRFGQVESKMKDDASFRLLEAKVERLMQQHCQKGTPELVHLGNGRVGPRPDVRGSGLDWL